MLKNLHIISVSLTLLLSSSIILNNLRGVANLKSAHSIFIIKDCHLKLIYSKYILQMCIFSNICKFDHKIIIFC